VLGGTQSLHTDAYDEALALPTERAARLALRTQQVIAHETGAANVADPLGGSHFVESLTDEMERRVEEILAHLDGLGDHSMLEGVLVATESGWIQGRIADAAYEFERGLNSGDRVLVGVNAFTDGDDVRPELLAVAVDVEERQLARLAAVKAGRDDDRVRAALAAVVTAARGDANTMPAILDAVRVYATVGEIVDALRTVFGVWDEQPAA
jgi:methylmalonyl-CoA mutase N-terminal domain/subunit